MNAFCAKVMINDSQFSPHRLMLCSLCEEFGKSGPSIEKCVLEIVKKIYNNNLLFFALVYFLSSLNCLQCNNICFTLSVILHCKNSSD